MVHVKCSEVGKSLVSRLSEQRATVIELNCRALRPECLCQLLILLAVDKDLQVETSCI